MVESRPYSLSSSLPRSQNESILPCAFGKTLVTQTPTSPVHLPPKCEGKIEWQDDSIAANPSPFEQAEAHLVETMFYDQWAPSRENVVAKPRGTFVPRWEDVQDDPEPDLRELLARKKKRKEAPAAELDEVPQCIRI